MTACCLFVVARAVLLYSPVKVKTQEAGGIRLHLGFTDPVSTHMTVHTAKPHAAK